MKIIEKTLAKITIVKLNLEQNINPIQDGLFRGCSRMGGPFWGPLFKICHTYPTMMKRGTVKPYLRKTQKKYKSRDTSLEFCRHQHFFRKSEIQVRLDFGT